MSEHNDLETNKDVLGQALPLVFIKLEEIDEKKEKLDYSQVYVLPTIKTRYFSMLIDVIAILLLALGISTVLEKIGEVPDYARGILFVLVVVLYEPILVTSGTTLGQLLLNIRVRSFKNPEKKLAFPWVLLRFIVKIFLGWLSFITVTFNINRRAIHDFASGSIMIANKRENK
jgi:uncharacterized RDD family membrane protein YckC